MNSKIYESIPAELNFKIKNAKLNSQKNDVKFTTLLTPFSDKFRFYSLLLAIFLFVSTNLIGFHIYDFLVSRLDRETLYYSLTLLCHTGTYIVLQIGCYFLYKAKNPLIEQFKISKRIWPWEEDYVTWIHYVKKSIKSIAIMHLFLAPVSLYFSMKVSFVKYRFDIESFPEGIEIIWQILFCIIYDDFIFYWAHRILHHPSIYSFIHKKHHECVYPVSICGEYMHPLESLCLVIPTLMGPTILGTKMHFFTYCFWVILKVVDTTEQHLGYDFPINPLRILPFTISNEFHDFHHTQNIGNFGGWFNYLDRFLNTDRGFKNRSKKLE
jgi:sterol desaturase/sphingolipid hydroxylase (fatty acid hydroxylase superfamily)